MARELEEKNKALVLRAFDTLSTSVITRRRSDSGHRNTFNIVLTSLPVVRDCLTWSRACHQRWSMRREPSWRTAVSSLCTDGFRDSPCLEI
jgi:hypothetical protein